MKSRLLGSLILLIGLCLTLGSCLNDDTKTAYQQLQEDIRDIDAYLVANPPDPSDIVIRDARSGIRLVITELGTGAIPPTPENLIEVAYTGKRFSSGEQFETDDSHTFTLTDKDALGDDVIEGWKFAFSMMTEGTHATVYIPSGLAYGTRGKGSIPANAILIFDLVLKVVNTTDQQPQLNTDISRISGYLEGEENVQVDPSGLHYTIDNVGTGEAPGLYDHVRIRYTGRILDANETEFATNVEQGPDAFFSSRTVNYIHGLTIGLQKMNAGGKATFYIPSALAYGPNVNGSILANSVLIFEVELLEVIPNQQ